MTEVNDTGSTAPEPVGYEAAKAALEESLRLGIDAETDDPNLHLVVATLTDRQVEWIASWLAGEGFQPPRATTG